VESVDLLEKQDQLVLVVNLEPQEDKDPLVHPDLLDPEVR